MPLQLYKNDNISFMAAKNFTYAGVDYRLGEDFPQEEAKNIESLVRARYIIPVIEEWGDKPRHWYREVRLRPEVMGKLKTNQGEHLLNREKQIDLNTPDDVKPGAFDEWDETVDNADAIHATLQENIDNEENEDMANPGKQDVTYVDGKEESEPVAMLGLGGEPNDHEVITKEEDQTEPKVSDFQKDLYDGKLDAEDVEVAPDNSGEPEVFDPKTHSVDEVKDYLETADEQEKERVLLAEIDGKNRKGIVGDE